MTRAITPERILKMIDSRQAWYMTVGDEESPTYRGMILHYIDFKRMMEESNISYNERTIKFWWKEIEYRGLYEHMSYYNTGHEDLILGPKTMVSIPEAIAKVLKIKLTLWMPLKHRAKGGLRPLTERWYNA